MQTVSSLGEDALIQRVTAGLRSDPSVLRGPGDDCAVVALPEDGRPLLLKTDAVVENVHFRPDTPARAVGRKAMARVASDLASMGGTPRHAMVTLVMRRATEVRYVEELYAGMREITDEHGINIVGGETSRGDTIVISVAMVGSAPPKGAPGRTGGRAGDLLFVTGRLGGSLRGRHLDFAPRLREGRWLVKHFAIHAMMDVSDGLAKDLPRLATASGLDFVLDEAALPCAEGCAPGQAWSDGEDYELLFAIAPRNEDRRRALWAQEFPVLELTRIGALVPAGEGRPPALEGQGWDHFGAR
jgi:thiamine-monophosphate kinase